MKQFSDVRITWIGNGNMITGKYDDKYFAIDSSYGCLCILDHDYYDDDWEEYSLSDFDIRILDGLEKFEVMTDLYNYLSKEYDYIPQDIAEINMLREFNY